MSFEAMKCAMDLALPCIDKMVAVVLANHHNGKSGRCDPGKDKIMFSAGLSKSAVDRALIHLRQRGLIDFESTNGRHRNFYTLHFIDAQTLSQRDGSTLSQRDGSAFNPLSQTRNPICETPKSVITSKELKEDAPASPKEIIFSAGLRMLTDTGTKESSARTFLGKYAKQDETKLAEIIGHLAANPKVNPKAYIAAAFKPEERRVVV